MLTDRTVRSGLLVFASVLVVAATAAEGAGSPALVSTTLTLRNGNWFPLPAEDMKAAAGDAALDEISTAGLLELAGANGLNLAQAGQGELALYLSLIGKAETAQMTVTLTLPERPTFVASASISVRRLDYREIYRALQHVGREAAGRLNAKLRAADATIADSERRPGSSRNPLVDPEIAEMFERAQSEKHALRYDEARTLFERVARSKDESERGLREMARDELRYGLPAFEAKQSILALGGRISQPGGKISKIAHAENLYRQIQAENPLRPERVVEAQRALDELAVARRAMQNAIRSMSIARMSQIRMSVMEYLMVEGRCPARPLFEQMLAEMASPLELAGLEGEDADATRYAVVDPATDVKISLVCDRSVRIEDPPANQR
jgi:hypothetical protein